MIMAISTFDRILDNIIMVMYQVMNLLPWKEGSSYSARPHLSIACYTTVIFCRFVARNILH